MSQFNSIPELVRKDYVNSLFNQTFIDVWEKAYLEKVKQVLSPELNGDKVFALGDHLRDVFIAGKNTKKISSSSKDESQKENKEAGEGWERLCIWYLNLCSCGSRLVFRKWNKSVPYQIRNALTVKYGNFNCNSETDIIGIVFPDKKEFLTEFNSTSDLNIYGKKYPVFNDDNLNDEILPMLVEKYINEIEIGVIQCKSNWNENAQYPMLWDLIYKNYLSLDSNLSVGQNGYTIRDFKKFSYSFVTRLIALKTQVL